MKVIGYGVARLALISVKKAPDHRSEQVTQLLFGEYYEVIEYLEDHKWVYIRTYADQYEGWIDAKQNHGVATEHFKQASYVDYKISTDMTSSILHKKQLLTILIGSTLPISNSELFKTEEQLAFNGSSKSMGQRMNFDFLKKIALLYISAPYEWGGRSPFGIDCSGFIQIIFKICGYRLPRDAHQQANHGKDVKKAKEAEPGDLAFFTEDKKTISHVGLILSQQKIIHVSGKVRIDSWTHEGIFNEDTKQCTHMLAHIKRILLYPKLRV